MESRKFAEALIDALKNPTRAAIFYQLAKNPGSTATEIAKRLGEDFDVVHYHLKQLKRMNFVSSPKTIVRRNYIEKRYSLVPDFKERFLRSCKEISEKEKDISPEDSRNLVSAVLSVVRSIITESMKRLEKTSDKVVKKIMAEDTVEVKIVFCSEEDYLRLLGKLREILTFNVKAKTFDPDKKQYTITLFAIPKLD